MPANTEYPKWVIGTAVIATAICTATVVSWLTRYEVRQVLGEVQSREARFSDVNAQVANDFQVQFNAMQSEYRERVRHVEGELREVKRGLDDLKAPVDETARLVRKLPRLGVN